MKRQRTASCADVEDRKATSWLGLARRTPHAAPLPLSTRESQEQGTALGPRQTQYLQQLFEVLEPSPIPSPKLLLLAPHWSFCLRKASTTFEAFPTSALSQQTNSRSVRHLARASSPSPATPCNTRPSSTTANNSNRSWPRAASSCRSRSRHCTTMPRATRTT